MSDLPKSPSTEEKVPSQPLVSGGVLDIVQAGRGDLSDWIELMEAVEALCPVWPRGTHPMAKRFEFKL